MAKYSVAGLHRQCFGKKKWRSADVADKRAKQFSRRYGKKVRSYYCDICDGYHLSTTPERS